MTKPITPIFVAILSIFLCLAGCKEEKKEEKSPTEVPEPKVEKQLPKVMYVIAPSGLLLRKEDNLKSDQLAKMPYGTRVEVLARPENSTIEVANIIGNMIEVRYNAIEGFAYNGYLSQFNTPKRGEKPETFAKRLQEEYPEVNFKAEYIENDNIPATSEQLSIPATSWSEAFLIAKQLFDIPAEYNFPGLNGPGESSIKSRQEHAFTSSLEARRTSNDLTSIEYIETTQRLSRAVLITKEDNLYMLKQTVASK